MDFKEKSLQKNENKTISLRQHLTSLQTRDLSSPETIQEKRTAQALQLLEYQEEANLQLNSTIKKEMPTAAATKTASGKAVMTQAPAKETYKEKKEKKKRNKSAKALHPQATDISYDMVESLKATNTYLDNSFQRMDVHLYANGLKENIHPDILKAFSHGYKTNKKGLPATEEDEKFKRMDEIFYYNYITTTVTPGLRAPILDKMVHEVMSVNISKEMFTTGYVQKHAGKLQHDILKLRAFDHVMNDPANKEYFDSLPPSLKDILFIQCNTAGTYETALKNILLSNAVDVNKHDYVSASTDTKTSTITSSTKSSISAAMREIHRSREYMNTALEDWRQNEMNT